MELKEKMFQFVAEKHELEKLRSQLVVEANDLIFTDRDGYEEVERDYDTVNSRLKSIQIEITIIKNQVDNETLRQWGREFRKLHKNK